LLGKAANNALTLDDNQDMILQIVEKLYEAQRCQIIHSKAYSAHKVPFNPHDEKEVQSTLKLMDFIVVSLLQHEESYLKNKR
jgi:hypothetical protein